MTAYSYRCSVNPRGPRLCALRARIAPSTRASYWACKAGQADIVTAVVAHCAWQNCAHLRLAGLQVGSDLVYKPWASEGTEQWQREAKSLSDALRTKSGVSIGASNILLGVLPCEGLVRQLDNTVEKQFAKKAVLHPIQVFHPQSKHTEGLFLPLPDYRRVAHSCWNRDVQRPELWP